MKLSWEEDARLQELKDMSQSTMTDAQKEELEALRTKSDTSTLGEPQRSRPNDRRRDK